MRKTVVLVAFVAVIAGVTGFAAAYTKPRVTATRPAAVESGQPRVKLAVLVVFDQMRGDYLEKWRGLFSNRGFARLQSEGAWFTHCNYPYATTKTASGHASMMTGTCPDRHGIIDNTWFEGGAVVTASSWPGREVIGARADAKPSDASMGDTKMKIKAAGSPERLLAETVADVLRKRYPNSKSFGLSLKERSAVLPVRPRREWGLLVRGGTVHHVELLPRRQAPSVGAIVQRARRW